MLPTQTIKSTVTASGQNKESFFSHNPATFGLSKSQKTRTADKENSTGRWREISSGKADLVCHTNLTHTWARKWKVFQPTHRGLRHLYQQFWFSLLSSTYAMLIPFAIQDWKQGIRRGMWNASNALAICRVVFATAVAIAPPQCAKWSFQCDV